MGRGFTFAAVLGAAAVFSSTLAFWGQARWGKAELLRLTAGRTDRLLLHTIESADVP